MPCAALAIVPMDVANDRQSPPMRADTQVCLYELHRLHTAPHGCPRCVSSQRVGAGVGGANAAGLSTTYSVRAADG